MRKKWLLLLSVNLAFGYSMAGTVTAEEKNYSVKSESTQYVSVEYPVLELIDGYDQDIIDTINQTFASAADEYLESEQASMEENAAVIAEYNPDTVQYLTSEISCEGVYLKDEAYSVVQYYYSYSGGAHGYGMSVGTTYNLQTGEKMTMAELLGCDENTAREAIVDAYRVSIIGQVDNITEESIRGCFDSMEYWMTEEGLRVSIPTYTVACYAAGPQEVTVTPEMAAAADSGAADAEVNVMIDGSSQTGIAGDAEDTPLIIDGMTVENLPEGDYAAGTVTVINGIKANADDFIFPYSGERLLTAADLTRLAGDTLEEEHYRSQLAINEMLARYGYKFKPEHGGSGEEAYNHFSGLPWYEEAKAYCPYDTANDVLYNCLNETERQNVDIICEWQKEHECYY